VEVGPSEISRSEKSEDLTLDDRSKGLQKVESKAVPVPHVGVHDA